MKKTILSFLSLVAGFLALYALTAQRGLGWGDSGEFQFRILHGASGLVSNCESFATAHPLYVALAKALCRSPFEVTLVSSFFGALAVGGFYLCSRHVALSILLGLAHAIWWLSCVAEVYTMSLTFIAFETLFLLRYLSSRKVGWLFALFAMNALHLALHNVALLALPVYGCILIRDCRKIGSLRVLLVALVWTVFASFWLKALVVRGPADVLVGGYARETFGFLPKNCLITLFNLALSSLSFFVPFALWWWHRRGGNGWKIPVQGPILALFILHFLFFVRYFIISQFTFVLPSVFFAYLIVSRLEVSKNRTVSLAFIQLLLPVLAFHVLSSFSRPQFYQAHKYRNDAQYFALPWKMMDRSADRYAAELGGEWNGYPDCGKGATKK